MAIEDKLEEQNDNRLRTQNAQESSLEDIVDDKSSSWGKIILDTILYSPVIAASAILFGPIVTLSSAIPAIGFSIGAWWENKKKRVKNTWKRMRKELYSGNIVGHFDYVLFLTPDLLFGAFPGVFASGTLLSMFLTTLVLNPLVTIPYNIVYQTFTYLRDNVGWGKAFKGIFSGKIYSYLKDTYHNKIKKELWKDTKSVFKYMFPLHFFQVNYLPNPTLRMVQSVFINNPIYRIIMGKKKKEISNYSDNKLSYSNKNGYSPQAANS